MSVGILIFLKKYKYLKNVLVLIFVSIKWAPNAIFGARVPKSNWFLEHYEIFNEQLFEKSLTDLKDYFYEVSRIITALYFLSKLAPSQTTSLLMLTIRQDMLKDYLKLKKNDCIFPPQISVFPCGTQSITGRFWCVLMLFFALLGSKHWNNLLFPNLVLRQAELLVTPLTRGREAYFLAAGTLPSIYFRLFMLKCCFE